ncbi:hypothetical protein BST81_12350 [Leptolyngbya sp. 'hensonii']|uniref:hydrogenase maturation protease n=1 Tax=Leptolyngbya sp. 'hensonii' TaxID=1922337 RepID=UPI00094F82B9|nr:hydrogenase maturation protease [Leptolyngbya sp. 'hensonii']OLP17849.1 hypothetical protein BST81_12350 [Leptolyngbya sp. 'hensonii']
MNTADPDKIPYLVIGYGNTLRSDDGAGYWVAETISQWDWAPLRSQAVHQLTPDLALAIAQTETVIFIDATTISSEVIFQPLEVDLTVTFTTHFAHPRSLLALASTLYQANPVAYHLLIPASNFELGEIFSQTTANCCYIALEKIKNFVGYP